MLLCIRGLQQCRRGIKDNPFRRTKSFVVVQRNGRDDTLIRPCTKKYCQYDINCRIRLMINLVKLGLIVFSKSKMMFKPLFASQLGYRTASCEYTFRFIGIFHFEIETALCPFNSDLYQQVQTLMVFK